MSGWRFAVLAVAVTTGAALSACGGDGGESAATTTSSTASTTPPSERCVAPTYELRYPASWHVNDDSDASPCRWFHPEPFELPVATEAVGIAVHVRYEPGPIGELSDAMPGDGIVDRRSTTVDGRDAVRLLRRSGGEGLLPAGTEILSWFIAAGPRTLVATTTSAATEAGFDDSVGVVDEMVDGLRFSATFACSAAGLHVDADQPADLPAAVTATRQRIVTAALACDFETLGELAGDGERPFTFSFGASEDPASYWRDEELRGDEPMRRLALLLDLESASTGDGAGQVVWPVAHTYDDWAAVPEEHRRELRRLYRPEVIRSFEDAGAYLGHRIGIDRDGEWLYFVSGD